MKKRILLASGDERLLGFLQSRLLEQGWEVVTAGNEREVWQGAFDLPPDLLILDSPLKSRRGSDTYRSLIDFGFDPRLPVIFLGGSDAEIQTKEDVRKDRAIKFLKKPVNFQELLSSVSELLAHFRDEEFREEELLAFAPGGATAEE